MQKTGVGRICDPGEDEDSMVSNSEMKTLQTPSIFSSHSFLSPWLSPHAFSISLLNLLKDEEKNIRR